MTAGDNHILTVEIERFQKIFESCDGVNGADPLPIIYHITPFQSPHIIMEASPE